MKLEKDLYIYLWKNVYENNCNAYIINGDMTVLIDPGHSKFVKQLFYQMEEDGLSSDAIDLILTTHSHPDHLEGLGAFLDKPVKMAMSQEEERYLLESGKILFEMMRQPLPDSGSTSISRRENSISGKRASISSRRPVILQDLSRSTGRRGRRSSQGMSCSSEGLEEQIFLKVIQRHSWKVSRDSLNWKRKSCFRVTVRSFWEGMRCLKTLKPFDRVSTLSYSFLRASLTSSIFPLKPCFNGPNPLPPFLALFDMGNHRTSIDSFFSQGLLQLNSTFLFCLLLLSFIFRMENLQFLLYVIEAPAFQRFNPPEEFFASILHGEGINPLGKEDFPNRGAGLLLHSFDLSQNLV